MANSLNRDIEPGEVLVIRRGRVGAQYAEVSRRLFVARSGFGMTTPRVENAEASFDYAER